MSSYIRGGSTRHSDDTMDDDTDDKDDTKRKSRNLSEKKRRDQFNMLVNELRSMLSTNTRKMDKSTVLRSTISFLKNHNEVAVRSRVHEIQEDWKPSFLSNEEFTHLILEALDGFIIVISSNGQIYYTSQSVTSLMGYLPSDLANTSIYEIVFEEDQTLLYNVLTNRGEEQDQRDPNEENQVSFTCHVKIAGLDFREEAVYELVQFVGYFRSEVDVEPEMDSFVPNDRLNGVFTNDFNLVFVGTGRLQTPQLIREMSVVDSTKSEFTSRHSLEWKFLFLDHRAPPIIGYLPIEVLGTSGYDYYHVDDLDKVIACHEALMQKGEGTSCHYRFLTKGQQWIWLQTRFYITYNQWNSKPEFVVCTHRVVSYADVIKQLRKNPEEFHKCQDVDVPESPPNQQQGQVASSSQIGLALSPWSSRSSKTSRSVAATPRARCHGGPGSDTTSVSAGSQSSKHSHQAKHNAKSKVVEVSASGAASNAMSTRGNQQTDVNQASCVGFLEPPQYVAAIPVQPIITASFTTPAAPAVINSPDNLQQQNIVMTSAQNLMQDELQRKHEELQQLIVHQQEELRRVSEQLLFARYGILSPLLNVGSPHTPPSCSQTVRNMSNLATNSVSRSMPSSGVQDVSVFPVPITLSVPVVSSELFAHPLAASPLPATMSSPLQYDVSRLTNGRQSNENSDLNLNQQQEQQQQQQQQQQHHIQHQQQQISAGQPGLEAAPMAEPPSSELLTFQVCPQTDFVFSQIESCSGNE